MATDALTVKAVAGLDSGDMTVMEARMKMVFAYTGRFRSTASQKGQPKSSSDFESINTLIDMMAMGVYVLDLLKKKYTDLLEELTNDEALTAGLEVLESVHKHKALTKGAISDLKKLQQLYRIEQEWTQVDEVEYKRYDNRLTSRFDRLEKDIAQVLLIKDDREH